MKNSQCRIISVASGKGGVGKTSFSLNLAYNLAIKKKKVCIIDADLGLANIDVVLGINPKYTLEDLILNGKSVEEVIYPVDDFLHLLPGSSGIPKLADLSPPQRRNLIQKFSSLTGYDFIIIDNSPGIAPSVLSFCLATKELIVIITPEPTSITDGYALLKSLKENGLYYPPFLVLNRAKSREQIKKVMGRFQDVCKKFLGISILFLGALFEESIVGEELTYNAPVSKLCPNSLAGKCYKLITDRILNRPKQNLFLSDPTEVIKQSVIQFTARIARQDFDKKIEDPLSLLTSLKILIENAKSLKKDKMLVEKIKQRLKEIEYILDSYLNIDKLKKKIGVLSLDIPMKNLITDILLDKDYEVIDLLNIKDINSLDLDLVIYYHLPTKKLSNNYIKIFNSPTPILLISPFNYFIQHKNIKGFLKSPFNLDDFYLEVNKLINCNS